MNRCLICHRKLKDPESIIRKIGPTCWRRLQNVTEIERKKKRKQREFKRIEAEIAKDQVSIFEIVTSD